MNMKILRLKGVLALKIKYFHNHGVYTHFTRKGNPSHPASTPPTPAPPAPPPPTKN